MYQKATQEQCSCKV